MPTMTMLIGEPATGKSTFAEKWKHSFNIISSDDFIEARAKERGLTYSEVFAETIDEAQNYFLESIIKAVAADRSVIIDRTNLTKKGRKKLLKMFPAEDYECIAIIFYVDAMEQHSRLASRIGKNIPDNIISNMRNSYTPPSIDEGFNMIFEYEYKDYKLTPIDLCDRALHSALER